MMFVRALVFSYIAFVLQFFVPRLLGVVGCGESVVYLMSAGRPIDIGLQLGKACYLCSR